MKYILFVFVFLALSVFVAKANQRISRTHHYSNDIAPTRIIVSGVRDLVKEDPSFDPAPLLDSLNKALGELDESNRAEALQSILSDLSEIRHIAEKNKD